MWNDPLRTGSWVARHCIALLAIVAFAGPSWADNQSPTISWNRVFYDSGDTGRFRIKAEPGWIVFLATDIDPGPHRLPRIGLINLGLTPSFVIRRVGIAPPNGKFQASCTIRCGDAMLGVPIYAQAFALDPYTRQGCLSDPVATMFFDEDGDCGIGTEGCSAAFWSDPDHHALWPAPYTPDTTFEELFKRGHFDLTLQQALELNGGIVHRLLRETAAALLNAQSSTVDYDLTADQVIFLFDLAIFDPPGRVRLKKSFEGYNSQLCPL